MSEKKYISEQLQIDDHVLLYQNDEIRIYNKMKKKKYLVAKFNVEQPLAPNSFK